MEIDTCAEDKADRRYSQMCLYMTRDAYNNRPVSDTPLVSVEDAMCVTEELLCQLGLTDYAVVDAAIPQNEYWLMVFCGRRYKGMSYSPAVDEPLHIMSDYRIEWPDERIQLNFVRGNCVIGYADWRGPGRIVRDIDENVPILDFADIQNYAEQALKNNFAWRADDIVSTQIMINKISLGYKRVPMKDSPNRYMLIPAWTFQGTLQNEVKNDFDEGTSFPIAGPPNNAILVLSAIDGSLLYCYSG
jgi:hypothetical protein